MRYLLLLLMASPLAAQDRNVSIVPAEQTNNIYIQYDSLRAILEDVFAPQPAAMSDSVRQANFERNMEAFRELVAERNQECNTCGGANTTTKIAVGVLIPVLVWIAWELRGIKNNSEGVPGPAGKDGSDGVDGQDGKDGEDADDDDHYGEGN